MKVRPLAIVLSVGAMTAATAASAQGAGAQDFLAKAIKGDNSEIMLGSMAAERGASPALRAYGQTLHDDHSHAREQAVPLAQRMGVTVPTEPMPEAASERNKLEGLHGRAFDHEFASYMVKDHKKDIADFEREARQSGPTADLAKQTLPVLHKHLAMAERLSHGSR